MREDSAVKNAPYPPSWLNNLTSWVKRLPIPVWFFYAILLIVWELIAFLLAWATGDLLWGEFDFPTFFYNSSGVAWLVFHYYLEGEIRDALHDSKPLLNVSSGGFSKLEYEFATLPARPFLVLSVISLGITAIFGVWITGFDRLSFLILLQISLNVIDSIFMFGFFYRLIRLLRMISKLYASPITINLFDLAPVYGLSALGAKGGLLILVFIYSNLFVSPEPITDPLYSPYLVGTAIFSVLPLAAFFFPLRGINRRLVKEKRRLMSEVARRLEIVLDKMKHTIESGDLKNIGDLETALRAVRSEKDLVEKIPTWPWRPATLRVFLSSVFLPIFLWLIQQIFERFLDF